ncbi:MAG: hypothetical protein WC533_04445 [Candidatus Pacearchaeota archaeon]
MKKVMHTFDLVSLNGKKEFFFEQFSYSIPLDCKLIDFNWGMKIM